MLEDRTNRSLEVLLPVRRGAGTLRGQLERQLREAVRSGRLRPGSALPSSRALAEQLQLSRGVVVEVYDQLVAEGYLVARQGSATRVADAALAGAATPSPAAPSRRVRYDFRPGVPALDTFPRSAWLASLRKILRGAPHAAFGYGDTRGHAALREALAAYLGRVRGVAADPERILVCSGFAQGTALVCRALRRRGARRFAIEDPSHPGQRAIVSRSGLELVAVPVDDRGIQVDRLEAVGADAVLVTPAHQFPTGMVLAPERRAALVDWAERNDTVIVEDDYDAEYRYDREPIGAVQGLAPGRVVYAGSASKTLAPALRLGWLVLPAGLADEVTEEKALDDLASPVLEQLAFADLLSLGQVDRHLRRNRARYRSRRDALVSALRFHAPGVTVRGIAAGLHAVAELPPRVDEAAVVAAASRRSVGVYAMADYRFGGSAGPAALVLGYGGLGEAAIERGVRLLAPAISVGSD
ncbi:MAG TPA: PLP-dependent aminotransferase family protein [Actinomycetota bacterium]|nr:PLP-dependent aminotransferase family protein [Actinomycetota bacterium]